MRCLSFLLLFLFWEGGAYAQIEAPASLLETPATVLAEDGPALFQYWEIGQHPRLWSAELGDVPALRAYRDSLALVLGEGMLAQVLQFESSQGHPDPSQPDTMDNYALVHTGRLGRIRAIHWLEAEILNYQLTRYPLLGHPTEFHGFIAVHNASSRVRIYFAV